MKKKYDWIIALLLIVIILQLLIRFPVEIHYTETDCPKIICKDVKVDCECRCLNGTLIKEEPDIFDNWFIDDWDGRTYAFNSTWNWTMYTRSGINISWNDWYRECNTCWKVHRD